jgi:N-acetylmuramoyl-L-alanine amidase
MRLLIDPGHGGHDPGAIGPGGARESDIVLAVSLMIAGAIGMNDDHQCHLTRYRDDFLELDSRCEIANGWADIFVSIHCNAADSPSASGFEVWTSPGTTDADHIATSLWEALRSGFPEMRARLDNSDGDPDKESRFRVLVGTNMPAVLVELGFISNPEEELRLASTSFQVRAAQLIGSTILGVAHGTR